MICVALCFDDGYIQHYRIARELYKIDIPATFFVITGLKEYMNRKLLITKPKFLKELVDMGHEVGSHSHTHRDLTRMGMNDVEEECSESIKALTSIIRDSSSFGIAYPYGSFNKNVVNIAMKYFIYGRTMGKFNRWNEKPFKYALGGIGLRHLMKLPVKFFTRNLKLITIVFHSEPFWIINSVIVYLRAYNAKFVTLKDGLKCLGRF